MISLFGPVLAAVLAAAQAPAEAPPDRTLSGEVVDGEGKAVADALVVFYVRPADHSRASPIETQARTDHAGKFDVVRPRVDVQRLIGGNFLAFSPGRALGAISYIALPRRLVLQKPRIRTIKIEGPDGQPVVGARVAIRLLSVFRTTTAEVPPSLADSLATTTGPDGTTSIGYLAERDQLVAVRVTADSIGSQDFLLVERPSRASEPAVITIKLKSTGTISGRLVDANARPVAGQVVEVWTRGGGTRLLPNLVGFKDGPLRTGADGSFQTPANLQKSTPYRVAVREPGKDPIFSDWITIQENSHTLPLWVQRTLRTIRGRVVDRQGKAVAGAQVFQSGHGPDRTETTTEADGRFSLAGFRQGPVFVFVRSAGFRFHGQLIKATDRDVTAELTRESERPAREMKMLPDLIPIDESRALARRLLEPCWNAVAEKSDDPTKYRFLLSLLPADPAGVLQKLEAVKFQSEAPRLRLLLEIAPALAERDPEEAAAVAESIPDPATRSSALVQLSDRIPDAQLDRKLALLDRALQQARIATGQGDRLNQMGEVAERWYELEMLDKAKALFAEALKIATELTDKTDFNRGMFAAKLALVDLSAAELIARDFKGDPSERRILGNMAFHLAAAKLADCERLWQQTAHMSGLRVMDTVLSWKLATVDPARALRAVSARSKSAPPLELEFYVALGAKARDQSISRQAVQTALQGLDKLMEERPERYAGLAGRVLWLVEQIGPALVPEVLWRHVASRSPYGNPRADHADGPTFRVSELAVYDREVAAALFQRTLARMEQTDPTELASWGYEFMCWSLIDPRAAVARLEKFPVAPIPDYRKGNIGARLAVARSLARSSQERWRNEHADEREVIFAGKRGF
jgi:Carboxypeptidase regulatory-like domain